MATVREGNRGVLLIVDVQVGVMSKAWDATRIIKNVSRAVERARAQGVPVIWVQHSNKELPYGSPEWHWVPELVPGEGERLIQKRFNSSFERTCTGARTSEFSARLRPSSRQSKSIQKESNGSRRSAPCRGRATRPIHSPG